MRARILRLLLLTILVAAGLSSVAWTWALAQDVTQVETTGKQSAARIDRLEAALDQFAHDELIYVASGQIDTETLTATSNLSQQLVSESAWLLGGLAAGAAPSAGAVAEAVASLADVDGRARENIQAGLDLMAADLLFTETTRTRQVLREQLRALRLAESNAVADARATDLKQAWMALASVAILFAWGLVRSARRPASEAPANVTPQATEPEPVALNVVPRPDPRPDPPPSIDLRETAALCTAISRLQSEGDLQLLLSRASTLLNASGVVVWMAAGEEMFPVAWHGYDSKHLSQLGPIGHSSLNAAADAWRTGTLQLTWQGAPGRGPRSLHRCSASSDAWAFWPSKCRRAAKQTHQRRRRQHSLPLSFRRCLVAGLPAARCHRPRLSRSSEPPPLPESDRTRSAMSRRTDALRHLGGQRDFFVIARHSNLHARAGIGLAQFSHHVGR